MKKQTIFLVLLSVIFNFSCTTEKENIELTKSEIKTDTKIQYILTITSSEGGIVSSNGGTYDEGTEVTIIATPIEGYEFIGWEGISSQESTITINIVENKNIRALFQELIQYTVTVNESDGGSVGLEKNIFKKGDLVEITAYPDEGYGFVGWGGFVPPNTTSPNGSGENFDNGSESISFYIYENITLEPNFYWYYEIDKVTIPDSKNSLLNDRPSNIFKNLNLVSLVSIYYPSGVSIIDYNNDGNLDLIHCNSDYESGTNGILNIRKMKFFLGDENGYLKEDENYSNKFDGLIYSYRALTGDFDNNGFLDAIFVGTGFDDSSMTGEKPLLLLNNGDGSFKFERFLDYDVNGYWHAATSSDFDNDGRIEILLLSPGSDTDENGFTSKIIEFIDGEIVVSPLEIDFKYTINKLSVEFHDFNMDGYEDLIIAGNDIIENLEGHLSTQSGYNDSDGNPIFWTVDDFRSSFVWYGSPNGFINKIELPINSTYYKVLDTELFDIDNDGDKDIVFSRTSGYSEAYFQVIKNNIDSFEDVTSQYINNSEFNIVGGASANILLGDFNNDGTYELLHNDYDRFRNQQVLEFRNGRFTLVKRVE